jgi:hypothetical protein
MTVEELRALLGWGAVCNIAFLSAIVFLYLSYRDVIYRLYGHCFDIPTETINTVLFGALVFYELTIFAFFIMPYIALRFFM